MCLKMPHRLTRSTSFPPECVCSWHPAHLVLISTARHDTYICAAAPPSCVYHLLRPVCCMRAQRRRGVPIILLLLALMLLRASFT